MNKFVSISLRTCLYRNITLHPCCTVFSYDNNTYAYVRPPIQAISINASHPINDRQSGAHYTGYDMHRLIMPVLHHGCTGSRSREDTARAAAGSRSWYDMPGDASLRTVLSAAGTHAHTHTQSQQDIYTYARTCAHTCTQPCTCIHTHTYTLILTYRDTTTEIVTLFNGCQLQGFS